MKKSTIWIIVAAVVILAIIIYFNSDRNKKPLASTTPGGNSGGGKQNTPVVNTSTPPTIPCNPLGEKMIIRDCNWQNPVFDGCTYIKKDQKPGTNQCYWFKQ